MLHLALSCSSAGKEHTLLCVSSQSPDGWPFKNNDGPCGLASPRSDGKNVLLLPFCFLFLKNSLYVFPS